MTIAPTTGHGTRAGFAPPDVDAALRPAGDRVERRLGELIEAERARWPLLDADLAAPLDSLRQAVLGGGKRLRPAFCHWGWVAATGEGAPSPASVDAGAALELLHAFALVHDDVMDDADTRRGAPTTHVDHANAHRAGGWGGDAGRHGESVAILVGDLAHTLADALLAGAHPAARGVWRELQVELVLGQYLDVLRTAQGHADGDQARRIARLKSGRYTIEQPLRLGAALADGLGRLDTHLVAYGAPLGMAFQMRDDVLGAVGGSDDLGKPVGDDLREGKPTALLALARERARPHEAAVLERVGAADLSDDEVLDIQEALVTTGALREMDEEIAQLADAAVTAIVRAPIPTEARTALADLARFIVEREH